MLNDIQLPFSLSSFALLLGVTIGVLYGIFAERSKFCLRRALAGVDIDRQNALSVWLTGFVVAIISTQILFASQILSFEEHRLWASDTPFLAAILGGAAFGIGMILTRGCISRLTVLTGTGNLRALLVIIVFGLVANAAMQGPLSGLRIWLSEPRLSLPSGRVDDSISPWLLSAVLLVALAWQIRRHPQHPWRIFGGALIGLLVPITWWVVSALIFDEFDPVPIEGLSFTLPHAEASFWLIASTAVGVSLPVGIVFGVILGAFLSAITRKSFAWQSFESPRQTGRYILGAVLMGAGGVIAGGCTVGLGLSGGSLLSVTAFLALLALIIAAKLTAKLAP